MKNTHLVAISIVLVAALSACSVKAKSDQQASTSPSNWSAKMQELSGALNKLLPLVSSSKAFNDPANSTAIDEATDRLQKLSHQVRKLEKPAADPAFAPIAQMLDEDLARAKLALRDGNRDYARVTIRSSIGYCIQCHTQTTNGPSFPKLDLGFNPSGLSPLAQGDYFAATRQFDSALAAYRQGVSDSEYAKKDIFGWERAARSGLAISIRFKEDPKDAKLIAQAVVGNKSAPESLRKTAKEWNNDISRWSKEKKNRFNGPNALIDQAEALIKGAQASEGAERNADVPYLRASALLHRWLGENPLKAGVNEDARAKALYLAGRAAEETRELNFWTLHENYYQLCIETKPKSDIAKKCYQLLSDSIHLGYTGSSGTHLPREEALRLDQLAEKSGAQPK